MNPTLDILFYMSMGVVCLKLPDLFLSLRQKKKIQEAFEILALLSSDFSIGKYLNRTLFSRVSIVCACICLCILNLTGIFAFFYADNEQQLASLVFSIKVIPLAILYSCVIFVSPFILWEKMDWKERRNLFLIHLVLSSLTIGVVGSRSLYQIILIIVGFTKDEAFVWGVGWSAWITIAVLILVVATVVLALLIFKYASGIMLSIARFFLWRIAEYEKGALTWICLFIAVVLGSLKLINSNG